MWVITSTLCSECGSESKIQLLDHEPTAKEIMAMKTSLCSVVHVAQVEVNQVIEMRQA